MLQNIKHLFGTTLAASDGDIGTVKDLYFDDKTWVIRYLVADTGFWLTGRHVLISPHSFGTYDGDGKLLYINLTRKQIEDSPAISSARPVSRQNEEDLFHYYGWPAFWNGGPMLGIGGFPVIAPESENEIASRERWVHSDDKHLRSVRAITGYHIEATDGPIGHVSGILVDDKTWKLGELVVETSHWYSGKEILILHARIDWISYAESKVFVNLTKADIQRTAEHDRATHAPIR